MKKMMLIVLIVLAVMVMGFSRAAGALFQKGFLVAEGIN